MSLLLYKNLGEIDYLAALALQERLVERKQRAASPDILLSLEHPHVFTLGRGGEAAHMLAPGEVPVYRTSRGGDITYHGPGQLVVYPLIDLKSRLRKDVHRYLRLIEKTAILTLQAFGLPGERKPPWTGVWIDGRKIAAIGVAVRRAITYHGLALNVGTDLSYFGRIVPCGLSWAEVTSMQRELGRAVELERVREVFTGEFLRQFHYTELQELCLEDIPTGSRSERRAAPITSA